MLAKPDLERYEKGWKKCWKVWFIMRRIGEELYDLSNEYMTVQNIGLLFECRQVIETDTGLRHTTTISFNKLSEVDLPHEVRERGQIKEFLVLKKFLDVQRKLGRNIEL